MEDLHAAVIHEVKNQLAELVLRLESREDCARETAIVMSCAQHLTSLLLAYRVQSGSLNLNVDAASPGDLVQQLAAEYRGLFPHLEIEADCISAPAFAFFDQAMARIALSGVMHNACLYANGKIGIRSSQADDGVLFEIQDDGPGFTGEVLAAALNDVMPMHGRGTGLGMYLAGRIAALHRGGERIGYVAIDNNAGGHFSMWLP